MHVRILGSAAGGGFPQWNCGCQNCSALRIGKFAGKARTQAQIAISENARSWCLLGASPDLRMQIEATPELHPKNVRHSPVTTVVLTNADVDHVAGLLSLRELQPLRVYAPASVLAILRDENNIFHILNRVANQALWTELTPHEPLNLTSPLGEKLGLQCEMLSLGAHAPAYERASDKESSASACQPQIGGLILQSPSGGQLAYLPAVPQINAELLQRLENVDLLLFDGTFWSDDELVRIQGDGETARQMGHVPVGAPDGSLQKLAGLRRPRKIFVHINNTNPMLDESGTEYRKVRDAGWELAEDGWQLEL